MNDRWFLALLVLAVASFCFFSAVLVYPDLNLDYPFPGGDGLDWISNGLWWAGLDVRYTVRPPMLPWILAGLFRVGLLSWFPVVNQLVFHAGVVGLFVALRRRYSSPVAFSVASVFLVNASLLGLTLIVGADILAASLLMCAALAFVEAGRRPGFYPAAGLLGGMSVLAQQTALLFPAPVALTVLLWRRSHLSDRRFWAGVVLFLVQPALWFLTKYLQFDSPSDVVVRHWTLLGFNAGSAPYYTGSLLTWLGLPWVIVVVIGLAMWFRKKELEEAFFLGSVAIVIVLFFVLTYRVQTGRFLVYVVPFLAFPTAELLSRIRRPGWLGVVGLALAIGSATPSPRSEHLFLLWPAPAVVGHSPLDHREWKLSRRSAASMVRASPYLLVHPKRTVSPGPAIQPSVVAGDSSVVVLFPESTPVGKRNLMLYRVGNALERRVRLVSETVLPAGWWGWRSSISLGRFGQFSLERIELSPELGTAVVVRFLEPGLRAELDPGPGEEELRLSVDMCREIDSLLLFDDDFLAGVLEPSGEAPVWLQLLPFVTRTSSFYVIDAKTYDQLLAHVPIHDRVEVGTLDATRLTALGRKVWVVAD